MSGKRVTVYCKTCGTAGTRSGALAGFDWWCLPCTNAGKGGAR